MTTIEKATAEDVEEISELLGEIEEFYGGDPTPGNPDQIHTALFGEGPAATVLLARDGSHVLGLASYSFLWPAAGADSSLYLKELFVRETGRRRGVASALMEAVQTAAHRAGCTRVEWTADSNNKLAIDFYRALNFKSHDGKIFYRTGR